MPRDTDLGLVNCSVAQSEEVVEVVWARCIRYSLVVFRMSSSASGYHNSDPTRPAEDTTAIEWVLRYYLAEQLARVRHLVLSLEDTRRNVGGGKGVQTAAKW